MAIFQAEPGTSESDELELLLVLIKDYEDKHIVLPEVDPIDAIKLKDGRKGSKGEGPGAVDRVKGSCLIYTLGSQGIDLENGSKTERLFSSCQRIYLCIRVIMS